jgi:hypothetical protein
MDVFSDFLCYSCVTIDCNPLFGSTCVVTQSRNNQLLNLGHIKPEGYLTLASDPMVNEQRPEEHDSKVI